MFGKIGESIKNFVQKHKKVVIVGTTLLVGTAAGIIVYKLKFSDTGAIEAITDAAGEVVDPETIITMF